MVSAADGDVPEFLERFPDPTVRYDSAMGRRVVRWANDPAEDLLGPRVTEGRPLDDMLSTFDVEADDETFAEPDGQVVAIAEADGPTRWFLLRIVTTAADPPGGSGWLVFTDLSQYVGGDGGDSADEPSSPTVDQIVSVLSHDLRNPLEVAEIRLEAARETGEDVHFEKVELALDRIEGLIQDVRTVARGSAVVESTGPVALETVASDAWLTVQTDTATLEIDAATRVEADESRLRQVLENAFRNSVKHAGPEVTVHIGLLEDEDGFYVADDGPGIPAGEREDVFEPGHTTGGGTGFGLPIVRRAAEAHGWTATVTEGADGGARFEIRGVDEA